ncbi:hypothetical protein [Catalinimonas alkaloidigena]|nr:hypothetical protein [Catalinimonas alkaloidigena]
MNKTHINKFYSNSFVLDKSKAVRINDIIETNFKKAGIDSIKTEFKLILSNEKELTFDKFSNIFQIDNGRKNKAEKLKLNWSGNDNEVLVYFSDKPAVRVDVTGTDLDWTNELFAEIDEQIERTKVFSLIHKIKSDNFFKLISLLMISFVFPLMLVVTKNDTKEKLNITATDRSALTEIAKNTKTVEEKINFLFETQLKILDINIKNETPDAFLDNLSTYFLDWRTYMIIIPIIAILGILWYLLTQCYPVAVFDWGDMAEEYRKIVERRKLLWNIVIGSIVIGILTNFFVFSITSFNSGN